MIDDITEDATEPMPTAAQIIDHLRTQIHDMRELLAVYSAQNERIRGVLSANGCNAVGDLAACVSDAITQGDGR